MKKLLTLLIAVLMFQFIIAQNYHIEWLGGKGTEVYDLAREMAIFSNGDLLVTGTLRTPTYILDTIVNGDGTLRNYIARVSPRKELIWLTPVPAGPPPNAVHVSKFDETYYMQNNDGIVYLSKFNGNGSLIYKKPFYGSMSINTDLNGNLIATGSLNGTYVFNNENLGTYQLRDRLMHKIDTSGNTIWFKKIHTFEAGITPSNFVLNQMFFDEYNNYFYIGTSSSGVILSNKSIDAIGDDLVMAKFNHDGELQNVKHFKNDSIRVTRLYSELRNGYIYIAAQENHVNNFVNLTMLVKKVDLNGNVIWNNRYSQLSNRPYLKNIAVGDNELFVAAHYAASFTTPGGTFTQSPRLFLMELDLDGNYKWGFNFGSFTSDQLANIVTDGKGVVYVTGEYGQDMGGIAVGDSAVFYAGPLSIESNGKSDHFLMKVRGTNAVSIKSVLKAGKTKIYPNPSTTVINYEVNCNDCRNGKLLISDLQGRMVYSQSLKNSVSKGKIEDHNLLPGIYLLQIIMEEGVYTGKVVVN